MQWCVYDNNADEVIGVWNDLDQAEAFWLDNNSDNWCVFPWWEVIVPSNV